MHKETFLAILLQQSFKIWCLFCVYVRSVSPLIEEIRGTSTISYTDANLNQHRVSGLESGPGGKSFFFSDWRDCEKYWLMSTTNFWLLIKWNRSTVQKKKKQYFMSYCEVLIYNIKPKEFAEGILIIKVGLTQPPPWLYHLILLTLSSASHLLSLSLCQSPHPFHSKVPAAS